MTYKEGHTEVQVRQNRLFPCWAGTNLRVNVGWIGCTSVGQVKEGVPMSFKPFPRQSQILFKKNVGDSDIVVRCTPAVEVVETQQQFPIDDSNVDFRESPGFKEVMARATLGELDDNPPTTCSGPRLIQSTASHVPGRVE